MEAAEIAFWVCTLLVQASSILWFLVSLKVFLDSGGKAETTCRQRLLLLKRSLRQWWHSLLGSPLDQSTSEELDLMRCRLTKRFWALAIPLGISRLTSSQLRLAVWPSSIPIAGIDIAAMMVATFGLTLQLKPGLLNPKSLDAWYVVAGWFEYV